MTRNSSTPASSSMRDTLCICRLDRALHQSSHLTSQPSHLIRHAYSGTTSPTVSPTCHHCRVPCSPASMQDLQHPAAPSLYIQATFVDLSIFLSKVQTSDTRTDRPDRREQAPQLTTPFPAPPSPPHLRPAIVAIRAEKSSSSVHLPTSPSPSVLPSSWTDLLRILNPSLPPQSKFYLS